MIGYVRMRFTYNFYLDLVQIQLAHCIWAKEIAVEMSSDMEAKDFTSNDSGNAQSHFSRNIFCTSSKSELISLGSNVPTVLSASLA